MRVDQILSDRLNVVTTVVDITGVDLGPDQIEGLRHHRHPRGQVHRLHVEPGQVLLTLLGPNSAVHAGLESLAAMLDRVAPGAHALVLIGWAADELPADDLLTALDAVGAETVVALPLEETPVDGVLCALLLERTPTARREVNRRTLAELRRLVTSVAPAPGARPAPPSSASRPTPPAVRRYARAALRLPRQVARRMRSGSLRERVVPIALPATGRAPGAPDLLTITCPQDLIVPRRLAEHGLVGFETAAMACFLAACDVASAGAVFDIGANVGIYAAIGSAMTERVVVAFEPWQMLVDVARRFSDDNGLGFQVETFALGAQTATAAFYLSDAGDSSNSLAKGFRRSSTTIEVPVETVDSYVGRTGIVPAVMKVDTETTEPDVLSGAQHTLDEHRPWILCEVLAGRIETRLQDVLAPFGYRWYNITDNVPLREAARIVGDPTHHNLMWLFAPEKPGDAFWTALRERAAALEQCTAERARRLRRVRGRG